MLKTTESLIKWLETFDNIDRNISIEQLCDGYLIARVLSSIAPDHFNNEWLTKIKGDISSDNWRLRISNLKKVLDKIVDWYTDVLNQNISTWISLPDINVIGKECNSEQLGRLLQLVVGIAVQCDKKTEYIGVIMGLADEIQLVVMQAVQEIMTVGRDRETSISMTFPDSLNTDQIQILKDQLRKALDELSIANEARELADQRLFEMEKALNMLKEEKEALMQENDKLVQKLSDETNTERGCERADPSDASLKDRHYNKLQLRIEALQEDLYKMESHKEEYMAKNEILENDLMELRLKNEDLQRKAKEARALKDELDILRHVSERVDKYEQMIEVYKNRLEEMSDLKRQVKTLEERNSRLVKTNVKLEEELKRSSTLKSQIDMYKKQVQDLHTEVAEQNLRADKIDFDFKRLQDKCTILKQEKDKLLQENDRLKSELEETRARSDSESILQDAIVKDPKCLINEINNQQMESVEDIREKVIKLEHANQMLRDKLKDSDDEKVVLLQTNLGDAKERITELEAENRNLNRSMLELKSQLQDLTASGTNFPANNQGQELPEEMPRDLETALRRISELQLSVRKKDHEMSELESKYKKAVTKARQVVQNLEPLSLQSPTSRLSSVVNSNGGPMSAPVPNLYFGESNNSLYLSDDVNELKTNLRLKERQIFDLEKDLYSCKALKNMEEKLMTVAFHNLAANVQRRAVSQRISNSRSSSNASLSAAECSSFLNKQRKAQTRRLNLAAVSPRTWFANS
ncbi:protein Hook homolog 3 isoform X1 [Tetranychus urticae]|uniref:protein Hook homolog 3 isoform X1 n=1 Tax=Tetranychus urticae TaxID=32264 RepID=UPI00077BE329|nr:protein Hook homolog 3 isoform X1 [Tetranychus urticae]